MKYGLLFSLIINVTMSFGQKYDFNSVSEATLPTDRVNVKLSTDFGHISNTQQSLKFTGQGSEIVFSGIQDPKEIRFDFLPDLLLDGQLNLIILFRKSGSENFIQFPSNGKISFNKNPSSRIFSEYFIPALQEGPTDIKLLFETTSLAALYLDNLEFIQFKQEELEKREKDRQYTLDATNITTRVITTNQIVDYNKKVDIIKTGLVDNLDQLRDLSYRANVLASLSKLVIFVNLRTKMGDPSSYKLFNDKIDFVKSNCNEIQKNFLDRLIADAKPKEFQVPDQNNKNTGLRKFIQVAGEVGNIISGGQLKSVVNSVQGLVSNLFDPNYLKTKIPVVLNYVHNNKAKSIPNPDFDLSKITGMINQGMDLQMFFYSFFDKLEADSKEFNDLVAEFKYYSEKTDVLLEEIELLRKDYFLKVKYNMTDSFYNYVFLAYKDTATTRQILLVKNAAAGYFDNLKIPLNLRGEVIGGVREVRVSELEDANNLNKRIIDLGKQYKMSAIELKNLFSKVESELKKNNPFSKYDVTTKTYIKDDSYKNSFEEYQQLKNSAETTFNGLKANIDLVLN